MAKAKLGKAALEALQQKFDELARERLPGAAIEQVAVLQYGDDPEIEPGELLARIVLRAGEGGADRKKTMRAFDDEYRDAIHELRTELNKVPELGLLEIIVGDKDAKGPVPIRRMRMGNMSSPLESAEVQLTPVMARLGPDDLETVDTLITAGIAGNRAEAVRWALARIRERPAYEKLRERAREIEELKAQF
ncbi:MAG TPA: hypothetical protein VMC83_13670 [Streptosporangiaceae bacterium]|nr:hypothetical protein [Streptosporangiaceae bacterium]